ncbi:uncharacterized protein PG986_010248 [Apiospora aurea]|uniref:Fumarylacetoacetase-like C-terminal domain-containing protein n=1 Tax=Apiospora aurea TaxID=335848 RepID=A0ABR1QAN2_9PEZI
MSWSRLIRFVSDDDEVNYGEPKINTASDLESLLGKGELVATEVSGSSPLDGAADGKELKVKSLLGPLTPEDVPIVRCIGLNYIKHIQEGGRKPPPYPSVFIKPSASIADHGEDIPIPKVVVQEDGEVDYEGELCIVIGKAAKDIPKHQALDHIAGYATGNDVSSRRWQRDPAYAGGVPQWCFSKGFDKWCPMGPILVSPTVVGAAEKLALRTWVNGGLRQDSDTSDLLFGVKEIVAFVSQGTTLEKGTVIMTGTPAGVAMGMKEPKYLQDGDFVEVEIEELGKLRNKMAFQS